MHVRRHVLPLAVLAALACAPGAAPTAAPITATLPSPVAQPPTSAPASAAATPPPEDDAAIPISTRNPSWGSRVAPVTIVEFADLQCPYSRAAEETLAALREAYGPDTLRIVWKNSPQPSHSSAAQAAEAAMGVFALAGADAFGRFRDLAFQNQDALGPDAYARWAQQAGARDAAAFAAGLEGRQWVYAVEQASQAHRARPRRAALSASPCCARGGPGGR